MTTALCENGKSESSVSHSHYVQIDREGIIDINAVAGSDSRTSEIIVEVYNFNSDVTGAKQEKPDNVSSIPDTSTYDHTAKKLMSGRTDKRSSQINPCVELMSLNKPVNEAELYVSEEINVKVNSVDVASKASVDVSSAGGNVVSQQVDNGNVKNSHFVWYAPPQLALESEASVCHDMETGNRQGSNIVAEQMAEVCQPQTELTTLEAQLVEKASDVLSCEKVPSVELAVHLTSNLEYDKPVVDTALRQSEPAIPETSCSPDAQDLTESEDDPELHEAGELLANLPRPVTGSQLSGIQTAAEQIQTVQPTFNWMNDVTKPKRAPPFVLHRQTTGTQKRAPRLREPFMFNCVMTNEKPHSCMVCGEAFRWEISLNIHLRLHTDGTYPNQTRKALGGHLVGHRGASGCGTPVTSTSTKSAFGHSRIVPRCASSDEEEQNDDDTFCFLIKPEEESDQPGTSSSGAKSYRRFIGSSHVGKQSRAQGTRLAKRGGDGKDVKSDCVAQNDHSINGSQSHCTNTASWQVLDTDSVAGKCVSDSKLVSVTSESVDSGSSEPLRSVQSCAFNTSELTAKIINSEITIGQEIISLDDLVASNNSGSCLKEPAQNLRCVFSLTAPACQSAADISSPASQNLPSRSFSGLKLHELQIQWCKHQETCCRGGFICHKCGCIVTTPAAVKRHRRRHALTNGSHTLACSWCPACFTSRSDLLLHRRVCHSNCHHSCRSCGRVFSSLVKLRGHQRIHQLVVRPSLCQICGKRYFSCVNLVIHQKKHSLI
jgi:hypothetical protein